MATYDEQADALGRQDDEPGTEPARNLLNATAVSVGDDETPLDEVLDGAGTGGTVTVADVEGLQAIITDLQDRLDALENPEA